MKKILLILLICLFAFSVQAGQKQLTFGWKQVVTSDLAGWRLYVRTPGGDYIDTPLMTILYIGEQNSYSASKIIQSPDGEESTYLFVLKAFDTAGNETVPSNEVSARIDFQAPGEPFELTVTVEAVPQ